MDFIEAFDKSSSPEIQRNILATLSRLYKKEAPYDGSWWWSTRPDTHGPYYKGITWEASPKIEAFLRQQRKKMGASGKDFFADLNGKNRMGISGFGGEDKNIAAEETDINLGAISHKKGQVGRASIEDVMLAVAELKGDANKGRELFTRQGCVACHSLQKRRAHERPVYGTDRSHYEPGPDC